MHLLDIQSCSEDGFQSNVDKDIDIDKLWKKYGDLCKFEEILTEQWIDRK